MTNSVRRQRAGARECPDTDVCSNRQTGPAPARTVANEDVCCQTYSYVLNGEGIQVIHEPAAHTDGDNSSSFSGAAT